MTWPPDGIAFVAQLRCGIVLHVQEELSIRVDVSVPAGMAVSRPQPGPEVWRAEVRQRGGHGGVRGLRGDLASGQVGA